jgi:hypothetical protein
MFKQGHRARGNKDQSIGRYGKQCEEADEGENIPYVLVSVIGRVIFNME